MYRSEEDLALLAELAGVLDQTVAARGLTSGTYLVLRELARSAVEAPVPVGDLAQRLGADGDEVAVLVQRLVQDDLAQLRPNGVQVSDTGRVTADAVEAEANEAMRAYVLERPHTATVYGLVAAMQSGRFTVEDLLEFIAEASRESEEDPPEG
ncbi:MAG TPA: helix-turn-helix domain-containing protein [Miltoncostaeaceae bacterium]|nr:helix-turn-helix domain-containing protein [Miltoncostaeaceae bacterium]